MQPPPVRARSPPAGRNAAESSAIGSCLAGFVKTLYPCRKIDRPLLSNPLPRALFTSDPFLSVTTDTAVNNTSLSLSLFRNLCLYL